MVEEEEEEEGAKVEEWGCVAADNVDSNCKHFLVVSVLPAVGHMMQSGQERARRGHKEARREVGNTHRYKDRTKCKEKRRKKKRKKHHQNHSNHIYLHKEDMYLPPLSPEMTIA